MASVGKGICVKCGRKITLNLATMLCCSCTSGRPPRTHGTKKEKGHASLSRIEELAARLNAGEPLFPERRKTGE